MLLFVLFAIAYSKLVSMVYYEQANCGGKPVRYQFLPPEECLKNTAGGSFKLTIEAKDVKFGIYNSPDTTCSSTPSYDTFQIGCNPSEQNIYITVNDTVSIKDKGWMLEAIYADSSCGKDVYAGIAQPDPNCKAAACAKVSEEESYEMICSPFTWPKTLARSYKQAKVDELTVKF